MSVKTGGFAAKAEASVPSELCHRPGGPNRGFGRWLVQHRGRPRCAGRTGSLEGVGRCLWIWWPQRPHKRQDSAEHSFWNHAKVWPFNQNVRSLWLCLCDVLGPWDMMRTLGLRFPGGIHRQAGVCVRLVYSAAAKPKPTLQTAQSRPHSYLEPGKVKAQTFQPAEDMTISPTSQTAVEGNGL